jgi:hypothetical protein
MTSDPKPPRAVVPAPKRESRSREQQKKDDDAARREESGAQALHPGRGWTHGKKK